MSDQHTRPTDPTHIAYAGTPDELWWSTTAQAWVKPSVPAPNIDKVVEAFSALRDQRTAKRHAWEAEDAKLEEQQAKLKAVMLDLLNTTGAKSIATDHGTVYRTEKIKPSAADWNVVYGWIVDDPERFELLEKRLKPTFVKQFMEEHDGAIPPGVNIHREYEVTVRRANGQGQE